MSKTELSLEDQNLLRMLKTPPTPHAPLKAKKTASRPESDTAKMGKIAKAKPVQKTK